MECLYYFTRMEKILGLSRKVPKILRLAILSLWSKSRLNPQSASEPFSLDVQYFIITVTETAQAATLKIGLANAMISAPVGFPLASRNKGTPFGKWFTQIRYVKADVDDGEITIGGVQEKLFANDAVVLIGRTMTLGQPTDGSMTVTGDIPYVMLNGRVLNDSLFGSLSHEIQAVIVGGMITALGWFVTTRWNGVKKVLFD